MAFIGFIHEESTGNFWQLLETFELSSCKVCMAAAQHLPKKWDVESNPPQIDDLSGSENESDPFEWQSNKHRKWWENIAWFPLQFLDPSIPLRPIEWSRLEKIVGFFHRYLELKPWRSHILSWPNSRLVPPTRPAKQTLRGRKKTSPKFKMCTNDIGRSLMNFRIQVF